MLCAVLLSLSGSCAFAKAELFHEICFQQSFQETCKGPAVENPTFPVFAASYKKLLDNKIMREANRVYHQISRALLAAILQ